MPPLSRRTTFQLGAGALAAMTLPSCETFGPPAGTVAGRLIDAHCHLFNGHDIPAVTFITRLFLRSYDEDCDLGPQALRLREIEDPSLIERLIDLLVTGLLGLAPTAKAETEALQGGTIRAMADEDTRITTETEAELARFLDAPAPAIRTARDDLDDRLRQALRDEAARTPTDGSLASRAVASRLVASKYTFGSIIRFVLNFLRSRQTLATKLAATSRSWQRAPLMLVPSMVDYGHWLGQTLKEHSSFYRQIEVWGAIARQSDVPVHGIVPFDPLRWVFWTKGRRNRFKTPEFDPMDLAEKALTLHGFLGLKIYPPMGFRATGNIADDSKYPRPVIAALRLKKDSLGEALDAGMRSAFDFCLRHDAPILAHANNSLGAGVEYGRRAEPRFWIDALKARPGLRLCLAHGGGFCWEESVIAPGTPKGQTSWEWSIGRYVRANPASHLYMDISFFSEILGSPKQATYVADQLRDWIRLCDPEVRHIIYGTDWTMLEQVPTYRTYGLDVQAFLRDRIALTGQQMERVMWGNAMRFLGLDKGKTRDRLLQFHQGRLPEWATLTPP